MNLTLDKSRVAQVGALIIFLIFFIFLYGFSLSPYEIYFDEVHYVPVARNMSRLLDYSNYEHPPLAKWIMAFGIHLFGDNPLGWRFFSIFLGSLSLSVTFLIGKLIFNQIKIAFYLVAIVFLSQLLIVQSRIATLDIYMLTFYLLSVWSALSFKINKNSTYFCLSALFFGLSISCKWGTLFSLPVITLWLAFAADSKRSYFKIICNSLLFVTIVIFTYVAVFSSLNLLPDSKFSIMQIFYQQFEMYNLQTSIDQKHTYQSNWWQWPTLLRPIWYYYKNTNTEMFEGIVLLFNPVINLVSLLAVLVVSFKNFKHFKSIPGLFIYLYWIQYLPWILISRGTQFYYYYLTSALISIILTMFLFFPSNEMMPVVQQPKLKAVYLFASVLVFLIFLPVVYGLEVPLKFFRIMIWFKSWI